MKHIETDLKTLESYHHIKSNRVFKKHNTIYKYEPSSEATMDAYRCFESTKYKHNLALATAYLYHKELYIGYTMRYRRYLFGIKRAYQLRRIKSYYSYFHELLELITEINSSGIYYWDFHSGNIKVTPTGRPFLLDLDGSEINPTSESKHNQCKYLSQFILTEYLNIPKTTNQYIRLLENTHTLSSSAIAYLYSTINSTSEPTLPFILLEEIDNKDLQHEIKKLLKYPR